MPDAPKWTWTRVTARLNHVSLSQYFEWGSKCAVCTSFIKAPMHTCYHCKLLVHVKCGEFNGLSYYLCRNCADGDM